MRSVAMHTLNRMQKAAAVAANLKAWDALLAATRNQAMVTKYAEPTEQDIRRIVCEELVRMNVIVQRNRWD